MAWLEQRGKTYHVKFRYDGKNFSKSLKTTSRCEAEASVSRLEENLRLLERGRLELPVNGDLPTFLLSDGKLNGKPKPTTALTLESLFRQYQEMLPQGAMEENSFATVKIHMKHLTRHFGSRFVVGQLTAARLQEYVEHRSLEKNTRGRPLSPITIRKEITSFGSIWTWAVQMGFVTGEFPNRGLKYQKTAEKPPFQTWAEIEHQITRGGLTKEQERDLWDSLFLTLPEITELLQFVKQTARHPFIYPMILFAAHTGARRSEIIRSRITDFDFDSQTVLIHEKKRVRGTQTTRRVPLTPMLAEVMADWFSNHPGDMHTICQEARAQQTGTERMDGLTRNEAHHHFKETLTGSKWQKIRGFHVLRHSFASNCAAREVDQRIINGWMGHQTEEMVKRYRHLLPDQQQQAIQSVFGKNS